MQKTVFQHDTMDCGAACLSMVAMSYGIKASLQYFRNITQTSQEGVSLFGIVEGARLIGLNAECFKASVTDLQLASAQDRMPVIVHMNNNHLVVVDYIKTGTVFGRDPAKGTFRINEQAFSELWTGYVIFFEKLRTEENIKTRDGASKELARIFTHNIGLYSAICVVSLVAMFFTLCMAYVFQMLVDFGGDAEEMTEHNTVLVIKVLLRIANNRLTVLFAIMVIMAILLAICCYFRDILVAVFSKRADVAIERLYVESLLHSTLHSIRSRKTGDYQARMLDMVSVRRLLTDIPISLFTNVVMLATSGVLLFRINRGLFLLSAVFGMVYMVYGIAISRKFRRINLEGMRLFGMVQSRLKETIQGLTSIKLNQSEKYSRNRINNPYDEYTSYIFKGNQLSAFSGALSALLEQVANLAIVFGGFYLFYQGYISIGELMSFYMILSCFINPVKNLLAMQPSIVAGITAIERIEDVLELEKENDAVGEIINNIENITVDNVSFSYPNNEELIRSFSFSASKGETLSIIGGNGSGKSTFVKLISGIEKPVSGEIYINSVNIERISPVVLRKRIGVVPQEEFLMSDTIKNNITMGVDYAEDVFYATCIKAGILDTILNLPAGFETYVNEDGVNLSAGQKQGIMIARVLLRDPDVLILDESTTNYEKGREDLFLKEILSSGKIVILVSHSDNVYMKTDKRIVLEG